jgi:EF-P beta-lysylation protein EpmB
LISIWREIQRKNFFSIEKLALFLEWQEEDKTQVLSKTPFPLNIPLRLAEKIQKRTLNDPILKQFIPLNKELEQHPGFVLDPVKDATFQKESKLIHKYQGRALLTISSACAMHCRYCFRKNFPYETERKDFLPELSILESDPTIEEIILSGGDPLSLSNQDLKNLLESLEKIPHIKRIRFHTRFPIGIPERIDDELLKIFEMSQKQLFFVIHTNHPKELDNDIFTALKKIQKLGIPTLNQTVLLRGVNDSIEILKQLFTDLSNNGILPYYLHQLDKVSGSAHFEVSETEGKKLMKSLSSCLSGYSLPKYAKEEAGMPSKTVISYT